jgi:hypothetical protein
MPGVRHVMFRLQGGDWVAREAVRDIKTGNAKFLLSTGDLVWWGKQGGKPSDNPYWKLVNEDVLKQLPPPDKAMRDAGLEGRVFPAVGNHEVWDDSDVQGLLASFPYLKKFGVSDKRLIYKFDFQNVRFIFLWTGKYDYRDPTGWGATRPAYEEQMKQLTAWLDEAKAKGTKRVFHLLSRAGFLPLRHGPHPRCAKSSQDDCRLRWRFGHRSVQRPCAHHRGL